MNVTQIDSERVRQRMQLIRNRMLTEVSAVKHDAESLSDWRYYVGQFPIGSLAVAALLGYWLIPRRPTRPTVQLDQRTIEELAERRSQLPEPSSSIWTVWSVTLARIALDLCSQAVLGYLGQSLSSYAHADSGRRRESLP